MVEAYRRNPSTPLVTGLCGVAAALVVCGCRGRHRDGFPGETWDTITPADAGMDAEKLDAFVEFVRGSGCIVRHGRMVRHWGHVDHPYDVASAVKPVYAHLVYLAVADGRLRSLDESLARYRPGLDTLNPDTGHPDRAITWRHLLTQTACYGVAEPPGTAFDYSDYQSALLIDTLVRHVYETGYDRVDEKLVGPMLSDPLGCQDRPTLSSPRSHAGRLRISARDFARFGMLYLSEGLWGSRRVVPRALAIQAVRSPHPPSLPRTGQQPSDRLPGQRSIGAGENQEDHLNSYSYMWWTNGRADDGTRLLPDAPDDVFCAIGHSGGDALIVMPSLGIVLCWLDGMDGRLAWRYSQGGHVQMNLALKKFRQALRETPRCSG